MIVKCSSCAARFRLKDDKLAGKRVTLRCPRCRNTFTVESPQSDSAPSEGRARVMIAHSDLDLCNTVRGVVETAGFEPVLGHNGKEVLAAMDRLKPRVAIVDVALEGLYAFEVVDKVKQRPGLDKVKIILLSSVYNKAAYKRLPSSLYGADDYIEKHHIPDFLVPKINNLLADNLPAAGPAEKNDPGATAGKISEDEAAVQSPDFINSVNEKIQTAENREVSSKDVPERDRAERLARIIVSDVSLYYQDRIDEGILRGNWSDLLATEIREARRLFSERFPSPEIKNSKILEAAFLDLLEKRRQELGA